MQIWTASTVRVHRVYRPNGRKPSHGTMARTATLIAQAVGCAALYQPIWADRQNHRSYLRNRVSRCAGVARSADKEILARLQGSTLRSPVERDGRWICNKRSTLGRNVHATFNPPSAPSVEASSRSQPTSLLSRQKIRCLRHRHAQSQLATRGACGKAASRSS